MDSPIRFLTIMLGTFGALFGIVIFVAFFSVVASMIYTMATGTFEPASIGAFFAEIINGYEDARNGGNQ